MFVEAAVGRKMIQVGSENDPQKEWNHINTQLISTFVLYLEEKKKCCTITRQKAYWEILSIPHHSILEDIFGIRNTDKVIKEGAFFSHQSHLPATVDNRIITLHEYSYQKAASNCGLRPQ